MMHIICSLVRHKTVGLRTPEGRVITYCLRCREHGVPG